MQLVSTTEKMNQSLFQISIIFLSFAFWLFIMLLISHPLLRHKFFVPFVFYLPFFTISAISF